MGIYEEISQMVEAYYYDGDAEKFLDSLPKDWRKDFFVVTWGFAYKNRDRLYLSMNETVETNNWIPNNSYVKYVGGNYIIQGKEGFEKQYREIDHAKA